MIAKKFVSVSAFIAAILAQADSLEKFWIYPETELGKCWETLWSDKTDVQQEDPEIQATFNFDIYFNSTSKSDLQTYEQQFTAKDDPVSEANASIIAWILKNKPEDSYPRNSTKWPSGVDLPFMRSPKITEAMATELWDGKIKNSLGHGSYGIVFADGPYAMKRPLLPSEKEPSKTLECPISSKTESEKEPSEALESGIKLLDPNQSFHRQYLEFITQYYGTFTIDGLDVGFFEKIDGIKFCFWDAATASSQCRLLAQIAAGVAIIFEAGCIDTDTYPRNVITDRLMEKIKLIDRGFIIDLTQSTFTEKQYFYSGTFLLGSMIHNKLLGKYEDSFMWEAELVLKQLLYDCIRRDIENRISAAQAAEILQIFSSYLEIKEAQPTTTVDVETTFAQPFRTLRAEYPLDLDSEQEYPLEFEPEEKYLSKAKRIFAQVFHKFEQDRCPPQDKENRYGISNRSNLHPTPGKEQLLSAKGKHRPVECPKYQELKEMAIKDCPKGIPIALRKKLFNPDPNSRNKAFESIIRLAIVDPSYINTPSFFMVLFLTDPEKIAILSQKYPQALECFTDPKKIENLSQRYPQALEELIKRIYIYGNARTNEQDMPVSKELYERIIQTAQRQSSSTIGYKRPRSTDQQQPCHTTGYKRPRSPSLDSSAKH